MAPLGRGELLLRRIMIINEENLQILKAIMGKTGDNKFQPLRLDISTHTLPIIDYAHHEIHAENSFSAYYTLTTAATNAHRTGLYLKTPLIKEIHIVISFAASTAADFSICETPTINANAGTHTSLIYNRDRNSLKASGCKNNATSPAGGYITTLTEAQIAAASFNVGTLLRTEPLRIGEGSKPAGGQGREVTEYILKKDTAYIFLITNTAESANTHHILIDWYEHLKREA
jgi:hypothetical protein